MDAMGLLRMSGLALALGLALANGTVAESVTLGKARIDIPEGWEKKESGPGLFLTREYAETDETSQAAAMIQILPLSGPPEGFDVGFAQMVGLMEEFVGEDPMVDSAGTTGAGHQIRTEYRCCEYRNDVSMGQTVAGVSAGNEQVFAAMVFMNISSDHQEVADLDFEALVRSIRFDGDDDASLTPQNGDGGLDGVFTHLEFGVMPNMFGGMDFNSDSEITVFHPNGLFSTAIPTGGISLEAYCAATPTDCGTYRLVGGGWFGGASEIEMRSVVDGYGVIETETLSFAKDGDDLKINDGDYYRLPPFDNGTTFDGSWTYMWASSGTSAMSSGSVAVQRTLVLRPDGRFERDGWSGASTTGYAGGVTVSSDRPASAGRYTVSGYELTLTGDDGSQEVLSIFAPDRDDDGLLVINGANYLKAEADKKKGG